MKMDPKTLDDLEAKAKAEIAAVDDPGVTFYPAWEREGVRKQIADGRGPQATLNLIADLRAARLEVAKLRAQPNEHAAADLATLREIISTLEDCPAWSDLRDMSAGPVLCTLARLESMLVGAQRIPPDEWFPVEVRGHGGEPPRLVLQPIGRAGERLDIRRLRDFAEGLFHRARMIRILPVGTL